MARGMGCLAHTHTSYAPLERHHIRPLSRGGANAPDNLMLLCANAHSDAHYFLDLIEDAGGLAGVPYAAANRFGLAVRRVAIAGWNTYAAEFLAGTWSRHAAVWLTSGDPRPGVVALPYRYAAERGEVWRHVVGGPGAGRPA